jgi:hypothetical protein
MNIQSGLCILRFVDGDSDVCNVRSIAHCHLEALLTRANDLRYLSENLAAFLRRTGGSTHTYSLRRLLASGKLLVARDLRLIDDSLYLKRYLSSYQMVTMDLMSIDDSLYQKRYLSSYQIFLTS